MAMPSSTPHGKKKQGFRRIVQKVISRLRTGKRSRPADTKGCRPEASYGPEEKQQSGGGERRSGDDATQDLLSKSLESAETHLSGDTFSTIGGTTITNAVQDNVAAYLRESISSLPSLTSYATHPSSSAFSSSVRSSSIRPGVQDGEDDDEYLENLSDDEDDSENYAASKSCIGSGRPQVVVDFVPGNEIKDVVPGKADDDGSNADEEDDDADDDDDGCQIIPSSLLPAMTGTTPVIIMDHPMGPRPDWQAPIYPKRKRTMNMLMDSCSAPPCGESDNDSTSTANRSATAPTYPQRKPSIDMLSSTMPKKNPPPTLLLSAKPAPKDPQQEAAPKYPMRKTSMDMNTTAMIDIDCSGNSALHLFQESSDRSLRVDPPQSLLAELAAGSSKDEESQLQIVNDMIVQACEVALDLTAPLASMSSSEYEHSFSVNEDFEADKAGGPATISNELSESTLFEDKEMLPLVRSTHDPYRSAPKYPMRKGSMQMVSTSTPACWNDGPQASEETAGGFLTDTSAPDDDKCIVATANKEASEATLVSIEDSLFALDDEEPEEEDVLEGSALCCDVLEADEIVEEVATTEEDETTAPPIATPLLRSSLHSVDLLHEISPPPRVASIAALYQDISETKASVDTTEEEEETTVPPLAAPLFRSSISSLDLLHDVSPAQMESIIACYQDMSETEAETMVSEIIEFHQSLNQLSIIHPSDNSVGGGNGTALFPAADDERRRMGSGYPRVSPSSSTSDEAPDLVYSSDEGSVEAIDAPEEAGSMAVSEGNEPASQLEAGQEHDVADSAAQENARSQEPRRLTSETEATETQKFSAVAPASLMSPRFPMRKLSMGMVAPQTEVDSVPSQAREQTMQTAASEEYPRFPMRKLSMGMTAPYTETDTYQPQAAAQSTASEASCLGTCAERVRSSNTGSVNLDASDATATMAADEMTDSAQSHATPQTTASETNPRFPMRKLSMGMTAPQTETDTYQPQAAALSTASEANSLGTATNLNCGSSVNIDAPDATATMAPDRETDSVESHATPQTTASETYPRFPMRKLSMGMVAPPAEADTHLPQAAAQSTASDVNVTPADAVYTSRARSTIVDEAGTTLAADDEAEPTCRREGEESQNVADTLSCAEDSTGSVASKRLISAREANAAAESQDLIAVADASLMSPRFPMRKLSMGMVAPHTDSDAIQSQVAAHTSETKAATTTVVAMPPKYPARKRSMDMVAHNGGHMAPHAQETSGCTSQASAHDDAAELTETSAHSVGNSFLSPRYPMRKRSLDMVGTPYLPPSRQQERETVTVTNDTNESSPRSPVRKPSLEEDSHKDRIGFKSRAAYRDASAAGVASRYDTASSAATSSIVTYGSGSRSTRTVASVVGASTVSSLTTNIKTISTVSSTSSYAEASTIASREDSRSDRFGRNTKNYYGDTSSVALDCESNSSTFVPTMALRAARGYLYAAATYNSDDDEEDDDEVNCYQNNSNALTSVGSCCEKSVADSEAAIGQCSSHTINELCASSSSLISVSASGFAEEDAPEERHTTTGDPHGSDETAHEKEDRRDVAAAPPSPTQAVPPKYPCRKRSIDMSQARLQGVAYGD